MNKVLVTILSIMFIALTAMGANASELSKQEMDSQISRYVDIRLGLRVTDVKYSNSENPIINMASFGSYISEMVGATSILSTFKEVDISTDNGLHLNCVTGFDKNTRTLMGLINCSVYQIKTMGIKIL